MFSKFTAALSLLAISGAAIAEVAAPVAATAATTAASTGFFAGLGAMIAGFALTWPFLIAILFFGILAEHNDSRGFAIFFALIAAAVAYFFFSISLLTLAIGAGAYILFGFVWSFWRYKRHADKVIAENKNASQGDRAYALKQLHPKMMLSTITAWVIIWPFSMVENLLGDLINAIQTVISKVFRGIYYRIYDSAVAKLEV